MTKRILFISHDASRSGAPILLLSLLRWLNENTDIEFEVLFRMDGEMLQNFEELCPIHLFTAPLPPMPETPEASKTMKVLRDLEWKPRPKVWTIDEWAAESQRNYQDRLLSTLGNRQFSLLYSNTMVNGDVLDLLSSLEIPVITHVHELEDVIQIFIQCWPIVKSRTDHFIAASEAVKINLIENHSVPSQLISVVHEFVPVPVTTEERSDRGSLGLPEDVFLVCASGKGEWRKGPDIFVLLAERVCRLFGGGGYHFCWVGGWVTEQDRRRTMELVRKLGLGTKITFAGAVMNASLYFSVSDIFAMVSREDPFPIVCLEAALWGMPILCFDRAGGTPELVEEDAGFVVPFGDIQIMADRIRELSRDAVLREKLGNRARAKVLEKYTADVGARLIVAVIEQVAHAT